MATPQTKIDELIGGISVFNLALNVAGIINNQKNVTLYSAEDERIPKDMLDSGSILGNIDKYTNLVGVTPAIIDIEVNENCKLAEHPLENGKVRADNKIIMPTEITVKIALPAENYKDIWDKIKELKTNNTMIWVQTKNEIYKNMQIIALPFSLNVNNVSRITFSLRLREVLVANDTANLGISKQLADENTVKTGNKYGIEMPLSNIGNLGINTGNLGI